MGFKATEADRVIPPNRKDLVPFLRCILADEVYRTLLDEGSPAALSDVTAAFEGVTLCGGSRILDTFSDLLDYVKLSL